MSKLSELLRRKPTVPEAEAWNMAIKWAIPEAKRERDYFCPLTEATPVYKKAGITADIIVIEHTVSDDENDLIGKQRILLIQRKHPPFIGSWALPGGFLEPGEECVLQTAARELKEETGIIAPLSHLKPVSIQDAPKRDPRDHVVSFAFKLQMPPAWYATQNIEAMDDAANIQWFEVDKMPDMAFDHAQILNHVLETYLREPNFLYTPDI
jgi:8-oxo-dGTP diphosphatase